MRVYRLFLYAFLVLLRVFFFCKDTFVFGYSKKQRKADGEKLNKMQVICLILENKKQKCSSLFVCLFASEQTSWLPHFCFFKFLPYGYF